MKAKNLFIAATLGATSFVGLQLLAPTPAAAQSSTTGAIQGVIVDSSSGEKLAGVTVIATSPSLAQAQTAITDDSGGYKISDLPPGDYLVTFYYADITLERGGIRVGVNKVTPVFQKLNQEAAKRHGVRAKIRGDEIFRAGLDRPPKFLLKMDNYPKVFI